MSRRLLSAFLLSCCLALALAGCGNKGPLVLPEEEVEKSKTGNE